MLFLALRNVARHAAHSLLLAALFALAAFLFMSGNSFLAHANRSLRELFVENITGDLVIAARSEESVSLFGANTPAIGELIPIPVLKQETELAGAVEELESVRAVTPLVSGLAVMDFAGERSAVPVFGIEAGSYFALIDGLEITRGRRLEAGERGVMLTEGRLAELEADSGGPVELGSEVLLSTARDRRFRIRSAPLVGVFRYPVSMDYVEDIALVDADTVRALNRIQVRAPAGDAGGEEIEGPTRAEDVDELFGGAGGDADDAAAGAGGEDAGDGSGAGAPAGGGADAGGGITPDEVLERVRGGGAGSGESGSGAGSPGAANAGADADARAGGSAHFLLLRGEASEALRETAADYGAEVLSWRQAAGQAALLALLLQIVFNGGFTLFVIAVTLGATNIVLISTYRRTREIGTLRAIGTDDRRLRTMFTLEHLAIALAGWLSGLAATVALSAALGARSITVDNRLLSMLLGGRALRVPVDPVSVALCLLVVVLVVAVAVLVPLSGVIRKPIVEAVRGD